MRIRVTVSIRDRLKVRVRVRVREDLCEHFNLCFQIHYVGCHDYQGGKVRGRMIGRDSKILK